MCRNIFAPRRSASHYPYYPVYRISYVLIRSAFLAFKIIFDFVPLLIGQFIASRYHFSHLNTIIAELLLS